MHMKIGQMQDVRALFDEKNCFLKIPISDVNDVDTRFFEISALFTYFRPLASFWNTTYRHLQIDFPVTTDHKLSFKKKLGP